jgi:hypothetical protein
VVASRSAGEQPVPFDHDMIGALTIDEVVCGKCSYTISNYAMSR